MLSTTQAAPRGCDSSVPSLPRSAQLTAQLQPLFSPAPLRAGLGGTKPSRSASKLWWQRGVGELHCSKASPWPRPPQRACISASTAVGFASSPVAILPTQQGEGGERTNGSRGVLAASAAWFGLVSAAWPLPLPRVLPLGDPPFLLTASPAAAAASPPTSLAAPFAAARASTHVWLPPAAPAPDPAPLPSAAPAPARAHPGTAGLPASTPQPCLVLRGGSSFVPSSSSSQGTQQGSSDAVQHAGFVFQLTAPAWRCRMLRAVPLPPGYSHTPWACQSWARSCCSSRFPLEISRHPHLLPAAPSLAPADPGQRSRAPSSQSHACSTEPRRGRGHTRRDE